LIFVISTESEYGIFPVEQNKTLFDMAMQRADVLADAIKKGFCFAQLGIFHIPILLR
jgi:hypothetical protein